MVPGDDAERQHGGMFGGYAGRILLGLSLGWMVLQVGRFLLPALLPTIVADLGITLAAAGFAITGMEAAYALTQYPSGRLSDQLSRVTLVVPGLLVLTASFLLIAWTPTYAVLVIAAVLLGAGKGLFAVPARALVSDHFVRQRGRALGIFGAASDLGGVLAAGISIIVIATLWRLPFAAVAGLLGGITAIFAFWNREPYLFERASLGVRETARRLAATPQQRRTLVAYGLLFFVTSGMINFLPSFLQAEKDLSPALAGSAFALFFGVGMVAKPTAGSTSDRLPRRLVAIAGLVLAAAALTWLVLARTTVEIVLAVGVFAVGYKAQFPVMDAVIMDTAPDLNMGGDLGASRSFFLGVGSLGATYVGVVAGTYGYATAYAGLVVLLLLSATILAIEQLASNG